MKYSYYDLGQQQEESWVVTHLRGSAANVILLDPLNFDRYRLGQPFHYTGGLYTCTPVRLQIPEAGRWYLVIDCGGYTHRVRADAVDIFPPQDATRASEADATLVEARA